MLESSFHVSSSFLDLPWGPQGEIMDLLISLTAGKPGGQGKQKGGLETDDHLGIIPARNTYTNTHIHTHTFLMTLVPQGETKNFTYRIVFPKSYGKPPKFHCLPSPNLPGVEGPSRKD